MLALAAAAVVVLAAGAPVPPTPVRWVDDRVGFLSAGARDELDQRLAAYERSTGHQVVVWIGDTLEGAPLDDWAVRTFAAWKVGRAGLDDGIVVFVLAGDRAIDIEVGYGLEERVPDAVAARIIREVMTPVLQRGDRDGALRGGVDALLAAIEGQPWTEDGATARWRPSPLTIVLGVLAAIGFLILLVTHPRFALLLLWSVASGRGGVAAAGRGFRGGGGRSGGGGARGRW